MIIKTNSHVDLAEFSADVAQHYPVQVVRFAEVEQNAGLSLNTGGLGCKRHLSMLLAKKSGGQAGRGIHRLGTRQLDELASARAR